MKKLSALVLSFLLLAGCLAGCDATKEFTCEELTITVPMFMKDVSDEDDAEGFTFALDSSKFAVLGIREDFDDFEDVGDLTLEDYAYLVLSANDLEDVLPIDRATGDYKYFRYEADTDDGVCKYLAAVYMSDEAFWMVQFAALTKDYDETAYFEYLDSVKFD